MQINKQQMEQSQLLPLTNIEASAGCCAWSVISAVSIPLAGSGSLHAHGLEIQKDVSMAQLV